MNEWEKALTEITEKMIRDIISHKIELEEIFGKDHVRECTMQPDKVFITSQYGTEESCHHTGYEVLDGNEDSPENWWNVYTDAQGNYHLGR